ncbi:hypothetical protein LTR10_004983 [Elasticomyces elasticus]|nr:hypothetical protein LTR10_004983 [Elasticomyces elasticus]KAK4977295.1 hypothetical protein LTR42_003345 [Elasticomyces elasticus]
MQHSRLSGRRDSSRVAAQWFRNALQTLDLQAVLSPGPKYETLKWCFITIVIVAWQQIIGPERDLKYIRMQTANVYISGLNYGKVDYKPYHDTVQNRSVLPWRGN